jgi:hypothetical protein
MNTYLILAVARALSVGSAVANGHIESTSGMTADRAIPKYFEKNLLRFHYVHHKSHMDLHLREAGPLR